MRVDMISARRRALLRGMGALPFAAALPALARAPRLPEAPLDSARFAGLVRALPGRVLLPEMPAHLSFVQTWNLHLRDARPQAAAVVQAQNARDVQTAVRWAVANGVPLVARSGGHSYAGYSSTTGLVIDVSSMTALAYDARSKRVRAGGGVRNAHLFATLPTVGRTLTHGRCLDVGAAGLVLGGGVGFNMRRLGLTCDQLTATEMVLPDGRLVPVSATQNPDLWWAVRGAGGGNFGIHTSFTFRTFDAPPLTAFKLVWDQQLDQVLPAMLRTLHQAPRALGVKLSIESAPRTGRLSMVLLGQFVGTPAKLAEVLAPVDAIAPPNMGENGSHVTPCDYWSGQQLLADRGEPEFMVERSRYLIEPPSEGMAATVLQHLRKAPVTGEGLRWKGFLTGGAVQDVAPHQTAFVHRRDWLLTSIETNWLATDPSAQVASALDWTDAFYAAMADWTSGESYQNFIDDREPHWARAYHGANLERLVAVKRRVDPDNVFNFRQSIPLTVPAS